MKSFLKQILFFGYILFCISSFGQSSNDYNDSVNQWHKDREESLKKENGWLNLVGLYWLKPGRNSFGTGTSNDIVFPRGTIPATAGYFELTEDNTVTVLPEHGVEIKVNNAIAIANKRVIFHKDSSRAPVGYRTVIFKSFYSIYPKPAIH